VVTGRHHRAVHWAADGGLVAATASRALTELAEALGGDDVAIQVRRRDEGPRTWALGPRAVHEVHRSDDDDVEIVVRRSTPPPLSAPGPGAQLQQRLAELAIAHSVALLRHRLVAQQLQFERHHDRLTGLPNRSTFRARVASEIARADQTGGCAVGILGVNGFRSVNVALGDRAGDEVIAEIGRRLQVAAGADVLVGRLGGAEFAFLAPGCQDEGAAGVVARRLLSALDEPVAVATVQVRMRGSMGVALAPRDGRELHTVLRHADLAMSSAKQYGGGLQYHAPDSDLAATSPSSLAADLRLALARGSVGIAVQPLVDLTTGQVCSAEALARWRHPVLGSVDPESFVLAAERCGLVGELTAVVLDKALAACAAWRAEGVMIGIAVNLVARTLADPALPAMVAAALGRHGLDGSVLTLELTESGVIDGHENVLGVLAGLSRMGVQLAVDDFGTGYASMSYLSWLSPDRLKIDKSFVSRMHVDERNEAIVRAMVDLAARLGIAVVAEGVSEPAVVEALVAMGCHVGQGYLFAEPMSPEELPAWVRRRALAQAAPVAAAS
jgi:diguanylate cyclase (GGDEF)-like protein